MKDRRATALLNEPDKFEDTALHLAASKGFDEILRVRRNKEVEIKD